MAPSTEMSQGADSNDTQKKQILLVDDDPEIVESMKYALTRRGYDVLVARNGNEALAFTETKKPHLMILDLMMPKRSGFLVLEHIRQTDWEPVPVIVITANEGNRHREYAEVLGVDEYFCKPVSIESLLSSVDRLVKADS